MDNLIYLSLFVRLPGDEPPEITQHVRVQVGLNTQILWESDLFSLIDRSSTDVVCCTSCGALCFERDISYRQTAVPACTRCRSGHCRRTFGEHSPCDTAETEIRALFECNYKLIELPFSLIMAYYFTSIDTWFVRLLPESGDAQLGTLEGRPEPDYVDLSDSDTEEQYCRRQRPVVASFDPMRIVTSPGFVLTKPFAGSNCELVIIGLQNPVSQTELHFDARTQGLGYLAARSCHITQVPCKLNPAKLSLVVRDPMTGRVICKVDSDKSESHGMDFCFDQHTYEPQPNSELPEFAAPLSRLNLGDSLPGAPLQLRDPPPDQLPDRERIFLGTRRLNEARILELLVRLHPHEPNPHPVIDLFMVEDILERSWRLFAAQSAIRLELWYRSDRGRKTRRDDAELHAKTLAKEQQRTRKRAKDAWLCAFKRRSKKDFKKLRAEAQKKKEEAEAAARGAAALAERAAAEAAGPVLIPMHQPMVNPPEPDWVAELAGEADCDPNTCNTVDTALAPLAVGLEGVPGPERMDVGWQMLVDRDETVTRAKVCCPVEGLASPARLDQMPLSSIGSEPAAPAEEVTTHVAGLPDKVAACNACDQAKVQIAVALQATCENPPLVMVQPGPVIDDRMPGGAPNCPANILPPSVVPPAPLVAEIVLPEVPPCHEIPDHTPDRRGLFVAEAPPIEMAADGASVILDTIAALPVPPFAAPPRDPMAFRKPAKHEPKDESELPEQFDFACRYRPDADLLTEQDARLDKLKHTCPCLQETGCRPHTAFDPALDPQSLVLAYADDGGVVACEMVNDFELSSPTSPASPIPDVVEDSCTCSSVFDETYEVSVEIEDDYSTATSVAPVDSSDGPSTVVLEHIDALVDPANDISKAACHRRHREERFRKAGYQGAYCGQLTGNPCEDKAPSSDLTDDMECEQMDILSEVQCLSTPLLEAILPPRLGPEFSSVPDEEDVESPMAQLGESLANMDAVTAAHVAREAADTFGVGAIADAVGVQADGTLKQGSMAATLVSMGENVLAGLLGQPEVAPPLEGRPNPVPSLNEAEQKPAAAHTNNICENPCNYPCCWDNTLPTPSLAARAGQAAEAVAETANAANTTNSTTTLQPVNANGRTSLLGLPPPDILPKPLLATHQEERLDLYHEPPQRSLQEVGDFATQPVAERKDDDVGDAAMAETSPLIAAPANPNVSAVRTKSQRKIADRALKQRLKERAARANDESTAIMLGFAECDLTDVAAALVVAPDSTVGIPVRAPLVPGPYFHHGLKVDEAHWLYEEWVFLRDHYKEMKRRWQETREALANAQNEGKLEAAAIARLRAKRRGIPLPPMEALDMERPTDLLHPSEPAETQETCEPELPPNPCHEQLQQIVDTAPTNDAALPVFLDPSVQAAHSCDLDASLCALANAGPLFPNGLPADAGRPGGPFGYRVSEHQWVAMQRALHDLTGAEMAADRAKRRLEECLAADRARHAGGQGGHAAHELGVVVAEEAENVGDIIDEIGNFFGMPIAIPTRETLFAPIITCSAPECAAAQDIGYVPGMQLNEGGFERTHDDKQFVRVRGAIPRHTNYVHLPHWMLDYNLVPQSVLEKREILRSCAIVTRRLTECPNFARNPIITPQPKRYRQFELPINMRLDYGQNINVLASYCPPNAQPIFETLVEPPVEPRQPKLSFNVPGSEIASPSLKNLVTAGFELVPITQVKLRFNQSSALALLRLASQARQYGRRIQLCECIAAHQYCDQALKDQDEAENAVICDPCAFETCPVETCESSRQRYVPVLPCPQLEVRAMRGPLPDTLVVAVAERPALICNHAPGPLDEQIYVDIEKVPNLPCTDSHVGQIAAEQERQEQLEYEIDLAADRGRGYITTTSCIGVVGQDPHKSAGELPIELDPAVGPLSLGDTGSVARELRAGSQNPWYLHNMEIPTLLGPPLTDPHHTLRNTLDHLPGLHMYVTKRTCPLFTDYVRAGVQIALTVAVDMNLERHSPALTSAAKKAVAEMGISTSGRFAPKTQVEAALAIVGKTLGHYDTDGQIPIYGFGCPPVPTPEEIRAVQLAIQEQQQRAPTETGPRALRRALLRAAMESAAQMDFAQAIEAEKRRVVEQELFHQLGSYALYPLAPEAPDFAVDGIEGAITALRKARRSVSGHAPSLIYPAMRAAALASGVVQAAEPAAACFQVCMIITDGEVSDNWAATDALVKATGLPLFFVFVGVGGHGPDRYKLLDTLDSNDAVLKASDGTRASADIATLVNFSDSLNSGGAYGVVAAAFKELPLAITHYYQRRGLTPEDIKRAKCESQAEILGNDADLMAQLQMEGLDLEAIKKQVEEEFVKQRKNTDPCLLKEIQAEVRAGLSTVA